MALKKACDLTLKQVVLPDIGTPKNYPELPKKVFETRMAKLVEKMAKAGLDAVVIYADREHYHNFKFFAGFDPRFEEALLVIHKDKTMFAALGNECLTTAVNSKLPITGVLCQCLSLPNQPMEQFVSLEETFKTCKLAKGMHVGAIDWKLMDEKYDKDYRHKSGMPSFIHEALIELCGDRALVTNETAMLVNPEDGVRITYGADEIAQFEYGSSLASQAVIDMNNALRPGLKEREVANVIQVYGNPANCHMQVIGGASVPRGMISPTDRIIEIGEEINLVYSLEGSLSCRHAVVARDANDLPYSNDYFIEEVVKPYLATVFNWYEMMQVGVLGGDVYDMVQSTFPKEKYGWTLNTGHLGATEEWLSSPMMPGSKIAIQSGTLVQMDIIPVISGYCSPNTEDGIVVADAALRKEIELKYPEVYGRMMARRKFMVETLGLSLSPDVLPLSNLAAAYSPYLLSRNIVVTVK